MPTRTHWPHCLFLFGLVFSWHRSCCRGRHLLFSIHLLNYIHVSLNRLLYGASLSKTSITGHRVDFCCFFCVFFFGGASWISSGGARVVRSIDPRERTLRAPLGFAPNGRDPRRKSPIRIATVDTLPSFTCVSFPIEFRRIQSRFNGHDWLRFSMTEFVSFFQVQYRSIIHVDLDFTEFFFQSNAKWFDQLFHGLVNQVMSIKN